MPLGRPPLADTDYWRLTRATECGRVVRDADEFMKRMQPVGQFISDVTTVLSTIIVYVHVNRSSQHVKVKNQSILCLHEHLRSSVPLDQINLFCVLSTFQMNMKMV